MIIFIFFIDFYHFIPLGIVRVEQRNNTFFDMDIFEDGPYEVGGETDRDESLVPVPANSYLGRNECRWSMSTFAAASWDTGPLEPVPVATFPGI